MFDDEFESGADQVRQIADAVERLSVQPRLKRWTSLSACVLDAVWSVGSHYDRVVVPLVRRVLEPAATGPLVSESVPSVDSHPLPRLLTRFQGEESLEAAAQNRQRTSTRNGVTKADAALRFARTLVNHGVLGIENLPGLLTDPESWSRVDRALSRIPGEGQHGVRRSYFWMLCGAEDQIKPDRMVLRWLAPFGVRDPATARQVLAEVAALLNDRSGSSDPQVTPWQIDHAIWLAARERTVDPGF
jgi:hypothetical protein